MNEYNNDESPKDINPKQKRKRYDKKQHERLISLKENINNHMNVYKNRSKRVRNKVGSSTIDIDKNKTLIDEDVPELEVDKSLVHLQSFHDVLDSPSILESPQKRKIIRLDSRVFTKNSEIKTLPPIRIKHSFLSPADSIVDNFNFKYHNNTKDLCRHLKKQGGIIGRSIGAKQLQRKITNEEVSVDVLKDIEEENSWKSSSEDENEKIK